MDTIVKIKNIQKEINPLLNDLTNTILEDERFPVWSGCSHETGHHYGKGGLAQHTLEVIETTLQMHLYHKTDVPREKIFLSALYHDVGKMWDYEPVIQWKNYMGKTDYNTWTSTQHKDRIHHLPKSAIIWSKAIDKEKHDVLQSWEDDVLHAILAHHGQREWRSPVQPQTPLAHILHLCDSISARVYETRGL